MARKLAENQTYISYQDALFMWKDIESEFDVRLNLRATSPRPSGVKLVQYLSLECYSPQGEQTPIRIGSRGLEYPSNEAATFPIALIRLLSRASAALEEARNRKKESAQQMTF